jgi:hypothetical protein
MEAVPRRYYIMCQSHNVSTFLNRYYIPGLSYISRRSFGPFIAKTCLTVAPLAFYLTAKPYYGINEWTELKQNYFNTS